MTGQEVRSYIKAAGVCLWQVAEKLGLYDGNFSRRLRKPFTAEEFARISEIVAEIKEENNTAHSAGTP